MLDRAPHYVVDGQHLPGRHFGAILVDPPYRFKTWNKATTVKARGSGTVHYRTMTLAEIAAVPVEKVAARDCALFVWATWPMLKSVLRVIEWWDFEYKTCAFDWAKADTSQIDMFRDDADATCGMGYWTRANTEPCLLATRGRPRRLNKDVRMGIIEPRREHSRKPDCVHKRIERLVGGPYLELFARAHRRGWTAWGDEAGKFAAAE